MLEVISAIKKEIGRDIPVNFGPRRPGDPAIVVADATKARAALGWLPQFDDLAVIVRHAIAWETQMRTLRERISPKAPLAESFSVQSIERTGADHVANVERPSWPVHGNLDPALPEPGGNAVAR